MVRSTSLFQLLIIVFLTLQANANFEIPSLDGGPRAIIQGRQLVIDQPVAEHLDITVLDEDGNVVATSSTNDVRTTISTSGWDEGDYTVQTINDDADYQEEVVVVID